jgi:prepilin-type N-terminal cleavage/methylation domain-containing protein
MRRTRGFTLIELLVVITIIGLLVGLTAYGLGSLGVRGRNSTRKADLERIKNVLEQYNTDTRSYPKFDSRGAGGEIYGAEWQLTSNGAGLSCAHSASINPRVTTKYIDQIPHDPKKTYNLGSSCPTAITDQSGHYLYISSSTSTSLDSFPTAFMLLATLEDPTAAGDKIALTSTSHPFNASGPARFEFFRNPNSNYFLDANYIVTGGR